MLRFRQILVSLFRPAFGLAASRVGLLMLVSLAGCGQTGPLYLPTEPAAAQRATLPQILLPGMRPTPATPAETSTSTRP